MGICIFRVTAVQLGTPSRRDTPSKRDLIPGMNQAVLGKRGLTVLQTTSSA